MKTKLRAILIGAVLACCGIADGMYATPSAEPVDRLVKNLTIRTTEHPKDHKAWTVLGRVHALAYERGQDLVPAFGDEPAGGDGLVRGGPQDFFLEKGKPVPTKISERAILWHLVEGLTAFQTAIGLNSQDPLPHASFAYLLVHGSKDVAKVDFAPRADAKMKIKPETRDAIIAQFDRLKDPATRADATAKLLDFGTAAPSLALYLRPNSNAGYGEELNGFLSEYWTRAAESEYLLAFEKAIDADKAAALSVEPYTMLVSYQAGMKYIQMVEARGPNEREKDKIEVIKAAIKKLSTKKANAVTPIVLSMRPTRSVAELTSPESSTRFDLDGTGLGTHWSWVKTDTGILVWDPEHEGKIDSGRRLFGNASWWLFFANGYQALDALDDNRDGELSGDELAGIRVWFDRNSDGVSNPSEVVDLKDLGIVALATHQTGTDNSCPMNAQGMRLADGRVLPTYDWIAHSLPESQSSEPLKLVHAVSAAAALGALPLFLASRRSRSHQITPSGRASGASPRNATTQRS